MKGTVILKIVFPIHRDAYRAVVFLSPSPFLSSPGGISPPTVASHRAFSVQ